MPQGLGMTDNDDLRERVAKAIAWSRFAREHPAIAATGQCKAIIPDALDQEDALAALSATQIEALQQRVERLEAELARRDANEKRNCINWGPCSRMDAALGDDVG